MSDNEIRQILIEERRKERAMQKREEVRELVEGALCWISWAALGYILFALGPIIAG